MNVKERIEQLRKLSVQTGSLACLGCGQEHGCSAHGCAILRGAAEDLEELSGKIGELEKQLGKVFGDIEKIRLVHGIDNWEADVALASLCEKYCAKSGYQCFAEGENHICINFEWKGKGEKKA